MIAANGEKCISCGRCIEVCPFTVLEMVDGLPTKRAKKRCIGCMHCGATCPADAITYDGERSVLDRSLGKRSGAFPEELENHLLARRSYRNFSEEPIPRDLLERAIGIADWCPSAKNQHPANWVVIRSRRTIVDMMDVIMDELKSSGSSPEVVSEYEKEGNNVVMGSASTVILCYGRESAVNAPADTAIAMTTVELFLQAHGVGTCWAGYLTRFCNSMEPLKALLPKLPEGSRFYGGFMAGYPEKEEYIRVPARIRTGKIDFVE